MTTFSVSRRQIDPLEGTPLYGIATDLKGFSSSTMRVRITDMRDGLVWCVTADIQHSGCRLVLKREQVEIIDR